MGPTIDHATKRANKNKNKNASQQNQQCAGQSLGVQNSRQDQHPMGQSSSVRTSLSGASTQAGINTVDGTADSPTPTTAMSSNLSNLERQQATASKNHRETQMVHHRPSFWMKIVRKYKPAPCGWWPCRAYRWVRDFIIAFYRGFWTPFWLDRFYTLALFAIFLTGCWIFIELLCLMLKPAAAQLQEAEANCSVVYVTIPGPVITVSLIGARPTDPNHGTYYYSVINGTTQWLGSIAPPTRFSAHVTVTPAPVIITTLPSGKPPDSSLPASQTLSSVPSPSVPSAPFGSSSIVFTSTFAGSPVVTTVIVTGTPPTASQPAIGKSSPSFESTDIPDPSNVNGQPPQSPVVVTSILTGFFGSSTATVTLSFGSNRPSTSITTSSSQGTVSSSGVPESSRSTTAVVTITNIGPGGQTSIMTRTLATMTTGVASSTFPPIVSASFGSASPVLSSPPQSSQDSSFTISLPSPFSSSVPIGSSILPGSSTNRPETGSLSVTAPVSRSSQASLDPPTSRAFATSTLAGGSSAAQPASGTSLASTPSPVTSGGTTSFVTVPSATSLASSIASSATEPAPGSTPVLTSSPGISSRSSTATLTSKPPTSSSGNGATQSRWGSLLVSSSSPITPPSSSSIAIPTSRSLTASSIADSARPPSVSFSLLPSSSVDSLSSTAAIASSSSPSSVSSLPGSRNSASSVPLAGTSSQQSSLLSFTGVPASSALAPIITLSGSSSTPSASSSLPMKAPSISLSVTPSAGFASPSTTTVMGPGAPPAPTMPVVTNTTTTTLTTSANSTSPSVSRSLSTSMVSTITSKSGTSTLITSVRPLPSNGTAPSALCNGSAPDSDCLPDMSTFMTKAIAYGDAVFSFVFPTPDIVTTVSYWTGRYPSITGPDWTDLPLTTRTARETLSSQLPSFEIFKSTLTTTPTRFKTFITTVVVDNSAMAVETKVEVVAATAAAADPGPESALCGESGKFMLNFDDATVSGNHLDVLPVTGLKNPYHHLFYANGFAYVPDKWEPYPAISQPNVAMFLPIGSSLLPNSAFAGTLLPGEFGAGPRAPVDAYWFNAYSGFFGCALNGITACTLRISGYRWDATSHQEVLAVEQNVTIPPCWGFINCQLTQVNFNPQFQGLSGIQFNAFTYNLGIPQIFMMDDLQLEWYNNTCSAGILRIGHS